ncbi:serine protease [Amycolatopsis antarctica]|uniref:Serine protease n=1 Tax=Amycolatopsis antarctica TaxID=1854586 RepID=A0A263CWU3_9PSEU|nr:S1 family peptidase [Amycolatopsis antarctica]OZM70428.1 serine protease [Amycolatopsis antarctica]
MQRKNIASLIGIAALAVGSTLAATMPASAAPAPGEATATVVGAMQRSLGITAEQAETRLSQEAQARQISGAAESAAAEAFGGSWFNAQSGKLTIGVTSADRADEVRATGAEAAIVPNSIAALDATKAAIDAAAGTAAPAGITGWHVDPTASTVVVNVLRGDTSAEALAFLDTARAAGPVSVVETTQAPRPLADIIGGDAYYIGGGRCSIGFGVDGGFVSAGHCGSSGDAVQDESGTEMGSFAGSSFPGDDYSYVETNSSFTPTSTVNGYGGGDVTVAGSEEAGVGSSICRSGSTTGWQCGEVEATNQTVNYAEGTVTGLTQTNACAEPGDSGGSWVSGNQAQGVTSGGSGNCSSGGTTYFQPVNEILSAYGLSLVTG